MSDISGIDHERFCAEINNHGRQYDEEDWIARVDGFWVPPAGGARCEVEIFKRKPRPPINTIADKQARKRSGSLCELCRKKFHQFQLESHHLHYRTIGHESQWDLLVLCRSCHRDQHADGDSWWNDTEQRAALDWFFDEVVMRPEIQALPEGDQ